MSLRLGQSVVHGGAAATILRLRKSTFGGGDVADIRFSTGPWAGQVTTVPVDRLEPFTLRRPAPAAGPEVA